MQMCFCVCLYVKPISKKSKDYVRSRIKIGYVLRLYTPVLPSVLEMEGIYVTGASFFEDEPLAGVYIPCI